MKTLLALISLLSVSAYAETFKVTYDYMSKIALTKVSKNNYIYHSESKYNTGNNFIRMVSNHTGTELFKTEITEAPMRLSFNIGRDSVIIHDDSIPFSSTVFAKIITKPLGGLVSFFPWYLQTERTSIFPNLPNIIGPVKAEIAKALGHENFKITKATDGLYKGGTCMVNESKVLECTWLFSTEYTVDDSTVPKADPKEEPKTDQQPNEQAEFSADYEVYQSGKLFSKGKYYRSEFGNRMQVNVIYPPTTDAVTIRRFDKEIIWLLVTASKQYIEKPFSTVGNLDFYIDNLPSGWTKDCMDAEPFENQPILKCVINGTILANEPYTATVWLAKDLHNTAIHQIITFRSIVTETFVKNIIFAPQPASLFELPAGYKGL